MHRSFTFLSTALLACTTVFTAGALPAAAQAVPYDFDPTYSENYSIDAFSSQGGVIARREGRKLARLPNGDIVVAGRMRLNNDTIQPRWNIGLVRYNRLGQRVTWTGTTGAYFHAEREYIVYPNLPNGGSGDTRTDFVHDIAYVDGKIYVLVTRVFQESPLDRDIAVFVFNEDGTYLQNVSAINSTNDEFGKAFDVRATGLIAKPVVITVLAERNFQRAVVAKLEANSSGVLSIDTNFGSGGTTVIPVPGVVCNNASPCNVIATDIARPTRTFGDSAPIYVSGAVQRGGTDWDFLAVKLNSDGSLDTSFGLSGALAPAFDQPGGDNGDYGSTLALESGVFGFPDTLWIAGNVSQSCKGGIGIAKFDGNGTPDASFGTLGEVVHGGSTAVGILCNIAFNDYAADVVIQGNEIAVAAGGRRTDSTSGETIYNGVSVLVDATTGALRSRDNHVFTVVGQRAGNSTLWGIVPLGNSRYAVSGDGEGQGFLSLYMSAVLRPVDTIFSDGLDP